jgi:hypothetical protein
LKSLEQNRLRNAWTGRRIIAVLLLVQLLFLLAVTSSESLHKAFHADAGKATHQCAITTLRSGQLETPTSVVVLAPAAFLETRQVVVESFFVPSVDFSLPPSCGPPALLS